MVKLSINFVGILPQTPSKGHNTIQRQRDTWYTVGHSAPIVSTSGKSDFETKEYCNLKTGRNGREGYTTAVYEYIHQFSSFLFFHAGNDSPKVSLQNKEKNFEGNFLFFEKIDEKKNDFQLIRRFPCGKLFFRYFDSVDLLLPHIDTW